jgi:peroxiredoxin
MNRFVDILRDPKRWAGITVVILVVGIGWIGLSAVTAYSTTGGLIPSPKEGFLAPDFTLETLDGGEITLSELRGHPVILNLWASWCPPCRAEMPALQRVYEANRERGLEILAVNMTSQDSQSSAKNFVDQNGLTFTIPLDRLGLVSNIYQSRALPSTFFVDRQGVIQKVVIGGPMSEVLIESVVEMLLSEGE